MIAQAQICAQLLWPEISCTREAAQRALARGNGLDPLWVFRGAKTSQPLLSGMHATLCFERAVAYAKSAPKTKSAQALEGEPLLIVSRQSCELFCPSFGLELSERESANAVAPDAAEGPAPTAPLEMSFLGIEQARAMARSGKDALKAHCLFDKELYETALDTRGIQGALTLRDGLWRPLSHAQLRELCAQRPARAAGWDLSPGPAESPAIPALWESLRALESGQLEACSQKLWQWLPHSPERSKHALHELCRRFDCLAQRSARGELRAEEPWVEQAKALCQWLATENQTPAQQPEGPTLALALPELAPIAKAPRAH